MASDANFPAFAADFGAYHTDFAASDTNFHGISQSLIVMNLDNDTVRSHGSDSTLSAGDNHNCTALDNGSAMCWGSNSNGQIGDGTTTDRLTPVIVAGLTNVKSISAGQKHTCTALDNGSAKCWGYNSSGQLGNGSTTNSATASNVLNLNNIRLH